jgi:hypothetical protein
VVGWLRRLRRTLLVLAARPSHAADAFELMAMPYEEPSRLTAFNRKLELVPNGEKPSAGYPD